MAPKSKLKGFRQFRKSGKSPQDDVSDIDPLFNWHSPIESGIGDMSGLDTPGVLCELLVEAINLYKVIRYSVSTYKHAPELSRTFHGRIQNEIVRIKDIAGVLFEDGVIDLLKPANAACVVNVFKELLSKLHRYGDFISDKSVPTFPAEVNRISALTTTGRS